MVSGSDRSCDKWHRDYRINGINDLALHHLYRAMSFLGDDLLDQKGATPFAPRCVKDVIEEKMLFQRRDLFTNLDLVFFDTTSIYFEGEGGTIGKKGHSKDHRPDLNQMVVGAVIDEQGRPVFHQRDENIKGHVFCSFLALVLKKELDRRLTLSGHTFEWADIKQDLKALQEVTITENKKSFIVRSECQGCCGKVFQSVGVAIPPTIREV